MDIVNQAVNVLRDWKRIADHPAGARPTRAAMWATHLRLKAGMLGERGPGECDILGWRVAHLGRQSLLHLYREIFVSRIYEVLQQVRAPYIIDCGSNIGMSILYFKTRHPDARIVGFEPHPAIFGVLARNIERNALQSVTLHQRALSDGPASLEFFVAEDDGALNMGLFSGAGNSRTIRVEADVLSRHIDREVDLLKLDIEGAEELVLQELARSGKLRQLRHIVCEYHHHIDAGVDRLSHTLALLEQAGFGYQIAAHAERPAGQRQYQDVVVYAYRRNHS